MKSRGLWLMLALLLCQSVYLSFRFPALEQYWPQADEGIFFRGGVTLLDHGPAGFQRLAQEFLARPDLQVSPPPLRVGHLLLSAGALSISRSFRALSVMSLAAYIAAVLVTYVFVRRWSGQMAAVCAAVLVMASPLGSDLAVRALSDSVYRLFAVLAALLCIQWSLDGQWRTGAWFLAALTWSAIVKEMTFAFLPAFAVVIAVGGLRLRGRLEWERIAALAVVPAVAFIVYVIVFGGIGTAASIIGTTARMNRFETNDYLRLYHDGPWFAPFVEALLLSPLTTIAFLVLCGWYLARRPAGEWTLLMLVLIAAGLATFAWLPHNPRYSNPLDVLTRIFVAAALTAVAAGARWPTVGRPVAVAGIALLAAVDAASFHRLFVVHAVYDPVTANLVAARNLVPSAPPRTTLTASEYLSKSLAFYRAGDFEASIAMARRAIAVGGELAEAYNNIGAALCELGRWQEAIAELETALRLKPNFDLARNNLRWAQTELQKVSAPVR
jgi:hypothetical protein